MPPPTPQSNALSGFTMLEIMIVIVISGITATIATPQMVDMYKEYKLRSATQDVVSSLQRLKLRAISENDNAVMTISEVNDTYATFVDRGGTQWARDNGEEIEDVSLREKGLEIESDFGWDTFGYDGKGLLVSPNNDLGGTIKIIKDNTREKQIIINRFGNFLVQ